MVSATLSAIMTTERKREWPLPFPGKKPLQTISALMCAGCCGAAFCTLSASGARAISAKGEDGTQDDVAHCLRNTAQLHPEAPSAIWYRYQAGRGFPARPHGQGKETLHFRWTCLCAGEISGAGILKNRFETAPSFSLFIQQFRIRQCGVKTALNGGYGASI